MKNICVSTLQLICIFLDCFLTTNFIIRPIYSIHWGRFFIKYLYRKSYRISIFAAFFLSIKHNKLVYCQSRWTLDGSWRAQLTKDISSIVRFKKFIVIIVFKKCTITGRVCGTLAQGSKNVWSCFIKKLLNGINILNLLN